MTRPRLLATFGLWLSLPAAAGVDLGGNLPQKLQGRDSLTASMASLRGTIKEVRWVAKNGRTVSRPARMSLGGELHLDAPAGAWTDVELVLDGPVTVGERALVIRRLVLPLDEPLETAGGAVVLEVDLSALDGVDWRALDDRELARVVEDGLGGVVRP